MKIFTLVALFCLVAVISAKKQHDENVDVVETEGKVHSAKKYSKEHQKSHHHNHKHRKHTVEEELVNESEPKPKKAPVEVPEPEIELQENLETSKKVVAEERHKEQLQDLHLQDLTYEENLKKEKKKGHHGAHRAEILEKNDEKAEKKLFAEHEAKQSVDEKVIEDSFEPIPESAEGGKNKKSKDGKKNKDKSKDKSKNKKKAYEKSKDGKKSKDNKKSKDGKKNKDKKNKNKKY